MPSERNVCFYANCPLAILAAAYTYIHTYVYNSTKETSRYTYVNMRMCVCVSAHINEYLFVHRFCIFIGCFKRFSFCFWIYFITNHNAVNIAVTVSVVVAAAITRGIDTVRALHFH